MHKVLKYIYLKGQKANRLDCTIYALEKMVNDKLLCAMIDLLRKRDLAKIKSSFSDHHKEEIKLEVVQQEHGIFNVESASKKDKYYEVNR